MTSRRHKGFSRKISRPKSQGRSPIKESKSALALFQPLLEKMQKKEKALGILYPLDREPRTPLWLSSSPRLPLSSGDVVRITYQPVPKTARRICHAQACVLEKLGSQSDPHFFSKIAALSARIPLSFSEACLKEVDSMHSPQGKGYEDLTSLPFVTIDDETARDFDDAVWATPDTHPSNPHGYILKIAIADVSYFVRPHSRVDQEAYLRGNSTYFPTHMIPMLPERLSTDLCSLKPHVRRPTLVATLTIDKDGHLKAWTFNRAIIQSHGRLTYSEVQAYYDSLRHHHLLMSPFSNSGTLSPEVCELIPVLYDAYKVLQKQRHHRGTLDFELPDPRLTVDEVTKTVSIHLCPPLESHQLIEEFMVAANRAAAHCLDNSPLETLFRIHPEPPKEKQHDLKSLLESIGLQGLWKGKLTPKLFSEVLKKTKELPQKDFLHALLLRMQSQALYQPENLGHFGLNLSHYVHFTSPIRRYADLLVHRSLVTHLSLGPGHWDTAPSAQDYETFGAHLSDTEKRSTQAERESFQRYSISTLENSQGKKLTGLISGLHKSGLFVTTQETHSDGFVPLRFLPKDVYFFNETTHTLQGRNNSFHLGDLVHVKVEEANPYTRSLIFSLVSQKQPVHKASPKKIIKKSATRV